MSYCKCIKFYNESSWAELDIGRIIDYLQKLFPYNIIEEEKKKLFLYLSSADEGKNSSFYDEAIVRNIKTPLDIYDLNSCHSTTKHEEVNAVEYNNNNNNNNNKNELFDRLLYDGFIVQKLLQTFMEKTSHRQQYQVQELTLSSLNIVITDKLLCTFDETDWRYHARSLICGNPTLISTSGIVEGIAKPRNYYYQLYFFYKEPDIVNDLKKEFKGQFIDFNDPRINDVIEGLTLQSLFYFVNFGDPFCQDKECRFYNAHFQDDLIRINIQQKKICLKHEVLINKYNQTFFNQTYKY